MATKTNTTQQQQQHDQQAQPIHNSMTGRIDATVDDPKRFNGWLK